VSALNLMSWIIGIANPLSALLVGTSLALLLSDQPRLALWCSGVGWLVLLIAQITFLAFGFKSGFPGFRFGQPAMIPIAAANFVCWVLLRRRARQASPAAYEYSVRWETERNAFSQTDWVIDEGRARRDLVAFSRLGEAELLRRPLVVIEVIASEHAGVAEPSKLG
jgi:hypothetical protein